MSKTNDFIEIKLNGKLIKILADTFLTDALRQWQYGEIPFAVAVNRTVVARSQYAQLKLHQEDEVEIVFPMQGG